MTQLRKSDQGRILSGPIVSTMLLLAVPIILGNLFQQLYNIVDAAVVGKFLGNLSLAGISVASPFMDIFNALLIGSTMGIGVLIARLFGAGQPERLKLSFSTALIGGVVVTAALAVVGMLVSAPILRAQGTEEEVVQEAMTYLRIVFVGMIFSYVYQLYASALRSLGDSRTPFFILLVSCALNVVLDVLFVTAFDFGISGIAVATTLCQFIMAAVCVYYTYKKCPLLALGRRELRFSLKEGKTVLSYAWVTALQQAVVCVGRFLTQGLLTSLGTDTVTGYNMGMRLELLMLSIMQGATNAMVVCISQCYGHGDYDRIRKYFRANAVTSVVVGLMASTLCLTLARQLIGIFSDNENVIAAGVRYYHTMGAFYIFSYLSNTVQGFFRGLSRLRFTMAISLGQITVRVLLSYLTVPFWGIKGICFGVLVGWLAMAVFEGAYAIRTAKRLQ